MNALFNFKPEKILLLDDGIAYELPMSVFASLVLGQEKRGKVYFKSDALFENECKNFPGHIGGMTNYESGKFALNREIFIEDGSKEWNNWPPLNIWTYFNSKRTFIYPDLFREQYIDSTHFCQIPLSTETPDDHLSRQESGNYDTEEIYGWPLLRYIDR